MSKAAFLTGCLTGAVLGITGFWINSQYASADPHGRCMQTYPNIPGKILLQNDKVVVQRFSFPPGQWEGVHAHPPNQLYIFLNDAHWKVRFGDKVTTGKDPAGTVGWYGPVDISEDHESVNIGDEPAELIWVTLQEGCPVES